LHDKFPWGESKVKVLISAKAGCSRLLSAFLLAISLTISSVQGRLSGPRHFKAPCAACPVAALLEVVFVVLAVPPAACPVAALLEVVLVVLAVPPDACPVAVLLEVVLVVLAVPPAACPVAALLEVVLVVCLGVGFEVDFDVGFDVGDDADCDVVCPIICEAATKNNTTVAIMIRFIKVFLLYPSVSSRR
jgi:hypothetical protein